MRAIHVEAAPLRTSDPYQELAIGIVQQAADDDRRLGQRLQRKSSPAEKERIMSEIKKISRFFLSGWYTVLSGSDNGADVLGHLDQEVFGDD